MAVVTDQRGFTVRSVNQIDWNDDQTIVNFVEGRWERRDRTRSQIEKQWYYNIAQFLGYQYHFMDVLTGIMVPAQPKYQGQVRLVSNRLMVYARKNIAKGMRQKPTWSSLPATSEDADLKVAKVNTKILAYYWRYLHMDRKLLDFWTWLSTTGNVFGRVYWDPDLGSEMDISQDMSQITPEQMSILGNNTTLNLGDAVIDVCSPFEIDPDPEALTLEEAKYLIHTKIRDRQYLEEKYEVTGLKTDSGQDSITRYYEKRIQSLVGPQGGLESKNTDEEENSVLTHTLWMNPTKKFPNGWVAVVAGGQVLTKGPIPNRFKRAPYVHAVEIVVPGRFWGTCSLEQCLSLQADYNRTRSQLCENRNRLANPQVLFYTGSGIDEGNFGNGVGEMHEVTSPALKPEFMEPPQMPENMVFKSLEYCLKDMEDITAVHEVTQARAPSGVRAGTAIAQLQEMDDQTLAPTFFLVEKAMSQLGSWLLQILAENINEERVVRLAGNDKQIEALTFTGKSLYGQGPSKPGVNYFDVEVQMGSQLPLTKIQRRDYAIGLVQAGILNPIDDKKKIYQILDLGTEEPTLNDEAQDRQNAMHENIQLSQGFMVEAMPWDNDMVHMDELRRYQKQPEFQELVKINPLIIKIFENHFAQHAMKVQAMMAPPVPQGDPNNPQDMNEQAQPAAGGPPPEQIEAPPPPQEPMNANL